MELHNARMLILGLLVLAAWPACAQVFRCESASGVPEYTNTPRERCARLDLAPLTTIPAPAQRPAQAGAAGAGKGSSAPGSTTLRSGTANGSIGLAVPGTPGPSAMRVDSGTQKARDVDRRRILEEELAKEQARLESLRQEIGAAESGQPGQPAQPGQPGQPGQSMQSAQSAKTLQSGPQPTQRPIDRTVRLREELGRTEGNLKALNREISSLKD